MATAPKPGASRRSLIEQVAVTVTLDDQVHVFRMGEMCALDAGALRRLGWSLPQLLSYAQGKPDIEVAAVLVWLARRQNGEPGLPYEAVAGEITYGNDFEFGEQAEAEAQDDSPEA